MSKQSTIQLTELDRHVIDAHHTLKTTKKKLDHVNSKIPEPVTKTIYYRSLKKLQNNPKTSNCVNKAFILMRKIELIDELENIQNKLSHLDITSSLQNMKKRTNLNMKLFDLYDKLNMLDKNPHTIFMALTTKQKLKSKDCIV